MECLEPYEIPIRENNKIVGWQTVPCLKCVACQERYKDDWAFRCVLELSANPVACMITLTFSEEGLKLHNSEYPDIPANSVCKEETDKFLKRFRKSLGSQCIRYFGVSEYGTESTCRPHYHFLVFGIDENHPVFNGKRPVYRGGLIHHYYIFNGISSWRYGQVEVSAGRITAGSIRYMLKYFVKQFENQDDNLLKGRNKLFLTFSRRPGLGFYGIQKNLQTLIHQRYGRLGARKIQLSRYIFSKLDEFTNQDISEIAKLDRASYRLTHKRQPINKRQWLINFKKGRK